MAKVNAGASGWVEHANPNRDMIARRRMPATAWINVMSFWSVLFGRRDAPEGAAKAADPVAYNGYVIRPAPYQSEGQFQTAGTIEKEIDGVRKEHRFVRADRYAGYDDAVNFTVSKARQIIDLQGDRIFE